MRGRRKVSVSNDRGNGKGGEGRYEDLNYEDEEEKAGSVDETTVDSKLVCLLPQQQVTYRQ